MGTIVQVMGNSSAPTGGDDVLTARLQAAGHTVTKRSDEDAVLSDSAFDGFMICPSCSSGTVTDKYATSTKPGIVLDEAVVDDHAMIGALTSAGVTQWVVTESGALDGGVTGTATVYTSTVSQNGATVSGLGAGAVVVATRAGASTAATYFYYPAGAALVGGGAAPAKRVGFLVINGVEGNLNSNGLALLDAAIAYAYAGGPVSLAATAAASSGITGAPGVTRPIAAAATAAGHVTGALARARPLAGTATTAGGTAAAAVAVGRGAAGSATAAAALVGDLTVLGTGLFQGDARSSSGASGSLIATRPLAATAAAASSGVAALTAFNPADGLDADARAASDATGALVVARPFAGVVAAAAEPRAVLNIPAQPPRPVDPIPPRSAGWRPRPLRRREQVTA